MGLYTNTSLTMNVLLVSSSAKISKNLHKTIKDKHYRALCTFVSNLPRFEPWTSGSSDWPL